MKNLFAPLLFNSLILVVVLSLVGLTHVLGGVQATKVSELESVKTNPSLVELKVEKAVATKEENRPLTNKIDLTIPDIF